MGFLILIAILVVFVLLFSLYTYIVCFHSPRKRKEDPYHIPDGEQYQKYGQGMVAITRLMEQVPCEYVAITAGDKTTLSARYYEFEAGAPLMILFHGYRSTSVRDSAGGFILAQRMGINVLAVDQRSHGKSSGRVITFGIRERKDVLDWISYANQRFGSERPIVLSGLSMGAATVLMASELDLPNNVVGIMADCPYSSPSGIIMKVCKDIGFAPKLCYPFIRLGSRLYGGFCMTEASAAEAVKNAKIPILLIHGEDDRFVPCDMSREIYDNCKQIAQLHTFPDAGHGLCYMTDPRRYEKICVEFLCGIPALQEHLQKSEFVKEIQNA